MTFTPRRVIKPGGRYVCMECHHVGITVFVAVHPFRNYEEIWGCTVCGEVDPRRACDVPTCELEATCVTPTKNGYAWTCGKPVQEERKRNEI